MATKPRILYGIEQIATFLDCGRDQVRRFVLDGAPIRKRSGRSSQGDRLFAEAEALAEWFRSSGTSNTTPPPGKVRPVSGASKPSRA